MIVKKGIVIFSIFIVIFAGILESCSVNVNEDKEKIVIDAAIKESKNYFNNVFLLDDIKYNKEEDVFDVLLISEEKDIKVWYQYKINNETITDFKLITLVTSPLTEYGLVLKDDDSLRQAQSKALLFAKHQNFTVNIAIMSDSYDKEDNKYYLKLITDSNDIVNLEIDMTNNNIKIL